MAGRIFAPFLSRERLRTMSNDRRAPRAGQGPAVQERPLYPFTAIAGQERMRLALLLHAVHPSLGGVLVRGTKGTAKSTAVRALAGLLPLQDAVAGCAFGCDPADRTSACDACAQRLALEEPVDCVRRTAPLVELPVGATEDRVLGSLDLEAAIQRGERHFEPGLLARANRGILYVDEVNLLGDHLVDILLDAAAMGRNYVEREAISFSHPASFMLIGTMNPEEGDLRPQLLDRFALSVQVEGLTDPAERAEAVRRRIAFDANPAAFIAAQREAEEAERSRLAAARALLPEVVVPEAMLDLIVRICAAFEVDGLRADLAIYRAASALAAYRGRTVVEASDVRTAAELALPHRRRRQPFEQPGLDGEQLDQVMKEEGHGGSQAPSDDGGDASQRSPAPATHQGAPSDGMRSPAAGGAPQPSTAHRDSRTPEGGEPLTSGAKAGQARPPESTTVPNAPLALKLPAQDRPQRRQREAAEGRVIAQQGQRGGSSGTTANGRGAGLALAASIRGAATHQQRQVAATGGPLLRIRHQDLRWQRRKGRGGSLVLFAVDASGSMGARERMAVTKSAVLGLLLDAYRRRDRTALVAFRGSTAELLLPPTNSVELAEQRLRFLPAGGRTPLAAGLALASATIERAIRGPLPPAPLLVVVSDAKANSAGPGVNPWQAALSEARCIREQGWPVLLLDADQGRSGTGFARTLATALAATHLPLASLQAFAGSHGR